MNRWKRMLHGMTGLLATAFTIELLVGLFGVPGFVGHWFHAPIDETGEAEVPRYVVVLGGGGIPSASGLMRTYYAAELCKEHTGLVYVVSLPCDGDPATNSVGRMRDELVMRGVPEKSILLEYAALNTHEQAIHIARLLGPIAQQAPTLIVTDPWHMRRAVGCFRKAGFQQLGGAAAVSRGAEANPGSGVLWRYAFWANLNSLVECARECAALIVYKLRGWI